MARRPKAPGEPREKAIEIMSGGIAGVARGEFAAGEERDTVVIVNETFARRLAPNGNDNIVGLHMGFVDTGLMPIEIVGVVKDRGLRISRRTKDLILGTRQAVQTMVTPLARRPELAEPVVVLPKIKESFILIREN